MTRRLGLIIPWAIFLAACLGWTIYWNVMARGAQGALEATLANARARGAEITLAQMRAEGFPLQLALDLGQAHYASADRKLRAEAAHLVMHVDLTAPGHVMFEPRGAITLTRADKTQDIAGDVLLISLRYADNALARASVEAQNLRIRDTNRNALDFAARSFVANARPDPRDPASSQAALLIADATLGAPAQGAEALGTNVQSIDAALVFERAAALPNIEAWRQAGGVARIEGLRVHWGAIEAQASGRLALDEARRVSGSLDMRAADAAALLGALAQSPSLSRDARQSLALAAVLTRGSLDLPLRAQDGALYLGPARLRALDPLYTP